uniref:Uncharacterized protein n=1 Tax=Oryza meridionalis TaxID=40149 RepID=A0A0E0EBX4_9ORYZ
MWLGAVVVSDADDGHLEVIYNGNFPRDDPFRAVRVAVKDVKLPAPRPAPTPANIAAPRPTTRQESAAAEDVYAGEGAAAGQIRGLVGIVISSSSRYRSL